MSAEMTVPEVIDVLRAAQLTPGAIPTVSQVRILVDDIWAMRHLSETLARPEMSGLDGADLISVAEKLGKYRARVFKQTLQGKRPRREFAASGMLFPPQEADVAAARALLEAGTPVYVRDSIGRRRRNPAFPRHLLPAVELATQNWGVIPAGYDRGEAHGRDVHASIGVILARPVSDAEVVRFVDRTYAPPAQVLAADHVKLLHWLLDRKLSSKLLELVGIGPDDAVPDGPVVVAGAAGTYLPLAKLMVAAYDLLDVARSDAVRALAAVVNGHVSTPPQVRSALTTASWLAPVPIRQLLACTDRAAAAPDNDRLARILSGSLATFSRSVRTNPGAYVVREVADLSDAHVSQILTMSGLAVDDGEEKAAAVELRTRLIEMGMRNDLDRELPEALRAWRAGRLEEYYSSRAARQEGDPDWARLYEVAPEAVAVSA